MMDTARKLVSERDTRADEGRLGVYRTPVVTSFGDIRSHTMGSTPGLGESANPTLFDFMAVYGDYDAIP